MFLLATVWLCFEIHWFRKLVPEFSVFEFLQVLNWRLRVISELRPFAVFVNKIVLIRRNWRLEIPRKAENTKFGRQFDLQDKHTRISWKFGRIGPEWKQHKRFPAFLP